MSDTVAIKVSRVSKTFKLPHEKNSSIKGALIGIVSGKKRSYEKQKVLTDISFEIKKGEFFGIVGRNGSGKSTLLKMLAGIYEPDSGTIDIKGRLTPFIELGVGFNPELTGRENVYLNGALLGFNRTEIAAMYKGIVKFAELDKFMDQKLKNYSSGMQVRLAFSIAIRAKSDILLIDEVLAVGDAAFQSKCFDYFSELKKTGATVIFVSHDRASLERFCERGVLINDGKIIDYGSIQKVLKSYSSVVLEELDGMDQPSYPEKEGKVNNNRPAKIINTKTVDEVGNSKRKIVFGEKVNVQFEVEFKRAVNDPILGITVWQKNVNKAVYATNTLIEGIKGTGKFKTGDRLLFKAKLPRLLNDGEYYLEPAIANEAGSVFLDQQFEAFTFFINGSENPHSIVADNNSITLRKLL